MAYDPYAIGMVGSPMAGTPNPTYQNLGLYGLAGAPMGQQQATQDYVAKRRAEGGGWGVQQNTGWGGWGQPAPQVSPQVLPEPAVGPGPAQPTGTAPAPGSAPPVSSSLPPAWGGSLYEAGLQGLGMGLQPFQSGYLDNVSQSLWNQANQNWADNLNPAFQNQSIMAGNFGDRSEIARGVMADRLNQSVFNAMAPVYSGAYENWLNRGVQTGQAALGSDLGYGNLNLGQYQADTQRQLGMGGLDVSRYNAKTNAAQAAAGAAGVPQYTNPWLAGIGALTSLYPFLFPKS